MSRVFLNTPTTVTILVRKNINNTFALFTLLILKFYNSNIHHVQSRVSLLMLYEEVSENIQFH